MDNSNEDWQSGLTYKERYEKLFKMGHYSDCIFKVGSNATTAVTFAAHKLILATSSPVFEAMLYRKLADNEKSIEILDMQPNILKMVLRYIYVNKIEINTFTQACEIFYAASKFMLPHLLEESSQYFLKNLRPNNVCRTLEFAQLNEHDIILKECHKVIKRKTEEVFQSAGFLEADICTLETILKQEKLSVSSELDVWLACVRWSSSKCREKNVEVIPDNQRNFLQDVIPLIRFLAMAPNEFAEGPARTSIITKVESYHILSSFVCSQTLNMPSNICINKNPRGRKSVERLCETRDMSSNVCTNKIPFSRKPVKRICETSDMSSSQCTNKNSRNSESTERVHSPLFCVIGKYRGRHIGPCCSNFYFRSSAAIILKGIRLLSLGKNPIQLLATWSVSEGSYQLRQESKPLGVNYGKLYMNYMFEGDVKIKPHQEYRLCMQFYENSVIHYYDIITPVVENNVTFEILKDKSCCCGKKHRENGLCAFPKLLFNCT